MEKETKKLLLESPFENRQKEIIEELLNCADYSKEDLAIIKNSITMPDKKIDEVILMNKITNIYALKTILETELMLLAKLKRINK